MAQRTEGFEPTGIYDFREGLNLQREPWLSPSNAWDELTNGYVFRGRTIKRNGYQPFSRLGVPIIAELLDDASGGYDNPLVRTLTNFPVLPREKSPSLYKVRIYEDGGTQEAFDHPTNIDLTVTDSGLVTMTITAEAVGSAPTQQFIGSLNNISIAGVYSDWTSGVLNASDVEAIANNYQIRDPARTLPAPANVVFTDGTQVITARFADVKSVGSTFVVYNPTGDVDPAFSQTLTVNASTSSYVIRFAAPTTGPTTVSYQAVLGTIDYATGDIDMTWPVVPTFDVKATYEYTRGNAVMGIHGFFTQEGNEHLIACDTQDAWVFDLTEERFIMRTGPGEGNPAGAAPVASPFTGSDSDFFDFEDFETFALINNYIDAPRKFDPNVALPGTKVSLMGVQFESTPTSITGAKLAIRDKNRLVYLGVKESTGTEFKNRARWTPVNNVEYTGTSDEAADDFVDAPTEDTIVTACRIGAEIIVGFERSWWRLRYTGDANSAYKWEELLGEEGASGLNSCVKLPEYVYARGEKAMVYVDQVSQRPADMAIPDLTTGWNANARNYSNSFYSKELREILTTFANGADEKPLNALSTHIDETRKQYSYSIYRFPEASAWHCFGSYRATSSLTYNKIQAGYNQLSYSYNSSLGVVGTPQVLVGDRNSVIWLYGTTFSDDGADVDFTARTKRLNPTPGFRNHLGWIDIMCDAVFNGVLKVRVRKDYQGAHFYEKDISLSPNGPGAKIKRRLSVNSIANFHVIELTMSNKLPFALDAIILYTKPAGMMRDIG